MIGHKEHARRWVSALKTIIFAAAVTVAVILFYNGNAGALSTSEWQTVAGAIDAFIDAQYDDNGTPGDLSDDPYGGEAGFFINATELKTRLDSNGDNAFLSEGDDAANAPVLVDVYGGSRIPGTSYLTGNYANATNTTYAPAVAQLVSNHRIAGFSYEIVPYCLTGHWGSLVMFNYGAMAHAGYFGTPVPTVRVLKWARLGWGGSTGAPNYNSYNKPYTATPVATPGPYSLATTTSCDGVSPVGELVRCRANATGSVITGGTSPWASSSDASYQPVDVRTTVDYYMADNSGNPYAYNVPLKNLFDATSGTYDNLAKLNPGTSKIMILHGRSPISGHMAAQGTLMLGYNARALRFGLPQWSGLNPPNWQEQWVSNPGYAFTSTAIDATVPTITVAPAAGNITSNSADISRTANEPATMKVEYGTASGVYTNTVNNTILNAGKTVSLSGLDEYTTYFVKVTSYDGQANGTVSSEFSFTTADATAPSITNVQPDWGIVYSDPVTISADLADSGSGINTSSVFIDVNYTTVPPGNCTVTPTSINCTVSGLDVGEHELIIYAADNAGNSNSYWTVFYVGDNVAPTVTYTGSTGAINTASPTLTATYADAAPTSGVNTASATVSVDGGSPTACTASGGNISCPASGLSDGAHTAVVSIKDYFNNTGSNSPAGSFTVDTTAPAVSNVLPSGLTGSNSPTIEANLSDTGSGINTATATISLDGGPALTGCTVTPTHISCPSSGLGGGNHTISVSVADNAGNNASGSGSFDVDATAPSITNLQPAGTIYTNSTTLKADYADAASGIDTTTAGIYLDGSLTALAGCSVSSANINCPVSGLADGAHTFRVEVADNAGNTGSDSSGAFAVSLQNYYYSWYDYGNATTRLFMFDPNASYEPSQAWLSCPGCWDVSRTRTALADRDNDGRVELNTFYDYGDATSGLFVFDPALGYEPELKWTSCPGCWDFSRFKMVTAADQLGAGLTEFYVLYGYDGDNTGLFIFDPTSGADSRVWLSGAGNWDWSRSRVLAAADYDGDDTRELAVIYDYGSGTTGIFVFDPDEWSAPGYTPERVWISGPGNFESQRVKVTVADQNNDGRGEIVILYDYGNATTGIFTVNPAQWSSPGYAPARRWLSNAGTMDWSRSSFLSGADLDADGITELAILYNYGGSNTGILQIDPNTNPAYTPGPVWISNGGGWDFLRTRPV